MSSNAPNDGATFVSVVRVVCVPLRPFARCSSSVTCTPRKAMRNALMIAARSSRSSAATAPNPRGAGGPGRVRDVRQVILLARLWAVSSHTQRTGGVPIERRSSFPPWNKIPRLIRVIHHAPLAAPLPSRPLIHYGFRTRFILVPDSSNNMSSCPIAAIAAIAYVAKRVSICCVGVQRWFFPTALGSVL